MQWIKQKFSHLIGAEAEQLACHYLTQNNLKLVEKNYRCKTGEIDLVMLDSDEWVFVEVKYRSSSDYGSAAEYFTKAKRTKLISAINYYLINKGLNSNSISYRIDLLAIDGTNIQWIKSV